jgi:hypothetical protein
LEKNKENMKKIFFVLVLIASLKLSAQTYTDASRIALNSVVLDKDNKIPYEANGQLESKLDQIASQNGVGGNNINPRFVIAVKLNITGKDIIAGPPQVIAINVEAVFFVGDAIDNQIYANTTLALKGVGTNENKAIINAIQKISSKSEAFADLIKIGKDKIVEYYMQKCDFIIKRAAILSQQQDYDQAIYELMQVPDVCKSCYDRCLDAVHPTYQKKIDREATLLLTKAKAAWNANQNRKGATEAADFLGDIEPLSSSYKEGQELADRIRKKIEADEKRDWDFKMKKYTDGLRLEQQRIDAARETAIAYYKNQPKTVTYNNIYWR